MAKNQPPRHDIRTSIGYVVVEDPSATYRRGAHFPATEVYASLNQKVWPDGLILQHTKSKETFKVNGSTLECLSTGKVSRVSTNGLKLSDWQQTKLDAGIE